MVAEGRLLWNVMSALRRALDEHPNGCLEAALWHGVEACFVPRKVFDKAVNIMIGAGGRGARAHGLLPGTKFQQR